jgi:hypothetical protein
MVAPNLDLILIQYTIFFSSNRSLTQELIS